jgi:DNA-binding GntR family transcriptional regulator
MSAAAPPATDRTLAEQAYRRVRADILAGRLPPDERLKLARLQADYGLGISPVREALMRLEGEGLVVGEPQRGYAVASVSLDDMHDLTRTRCRIEALMLRDAIDHGDAEWEAAIVAAFHRLSKAPLPAAPDDTEAVELWETLHRAFHDAVFAACRSPWLRRFDAMLVDHSLRYRQIRLFQVDRADLPRDVLTEHRAIMDAVLARDAARAESLTTAHVQRTAAIVAACWNPPA